MATSHVQRLRSERGGGRDPAPVLPGDLRRCPPTSSAIRGTVRDHRAVTDGRSPPVPTSETASAPPARSPPDRRGLPRHHRRRQRPGGRRQRPAARCASLATRLQRDEHRPERAAWTRPRAENRGASHASSRSPRDGNGLCCSTATDPSSAAARARAASRDSGVRTSAAWPRASAPPCRSSAAMPSSFAWSRETPGAERSARSRSRPQRTPLTHRLARVGTPRVRDAGDHRSTVHAEDQRPRWPPGGRLGVISRPGTGCRARSPARDGRRPRCRARPCTS